MSDSKSIDDGGQAFPGLGPLDGYGNRTPVMFSNGSHGWQEVNQGMTLLQFATIEIMKGLVSNPAIIAPNPRCGFGLVNCDDADLAGYAVTLANHTLAAVNARKASP